MIDGGVEIVDEILVGQVFADTLAKLVGGYLDLLGLIRLRLVYDRGYTFVGDLTALSQLPYPARLRRLRGLFPRTSSTRRLRLSFPVPLPPQGKAEYG